MNIKNKGYILISTLVLLSMLSLLLVTAIQREIIAQKMVANYGDNLKAHRQAVDLLQKTEKQIEQRAILLPWHQASQFQDQSGNTWHADITADTIAHDNCIQINGASKLGAQYISINVKLGDTPDYYSQSISSTILTSVDTDQSTEQGQCDEIVSINSGRIGYA